jgi:hypothetical protein
MNNNNLTYYQINKNILKLKLQLKSKIPEYCEKKKQYERQYYQKRKLIKKAILNSYPIPEYLISNTNHQPIVKIEYGPIFIEL